MAEFNPMKSNQAQSSGDTLQTQGNPVANTATGTTYTVAEGANYVSVWDASDFTVKASPLKDQDANNAAGGFTSKYPAGTIVEIPNVIGGKTIITVS